MSDFKDQDRLDDLRERLYKRGDSGEKSERHELSDAPQKVARNWGGAAEVSDIQPKASEQPTPVEAEAVAPEEGAAEPATAVLNEDENNESTDVTKPRKKTYRWIVLAASFVLLILVVGVSSAFLFVGGNDISPRNINVAISGPFAIGGGSELPLQVAITNQNTVPIKSAVLIMKYPDGTRSVGDNERDIFEERLVLDEIAAGETINQPVRVAVFGEENDEKTVTATVEYRLADSGGTFYKDSDPFTFKLNSAPVTLDLDYNQKLSSGQETEITLKVTSNAPNVLEDVLIMAEYPSSFDFISAEPSPAFGQNAWTIDTLEPEGEATIKLTGAILGQTDDQFVMKFRVGKAREDNQFQMGSVLATSEAEFLIEQPFIGLTLSVNGDNDGSAVIDPGSPAQVRIDVVNTLDVSVYDMYVEASLVGTAVREDDISVRSGFYNSRENLVRWDVSSNRDFAEVLPGERLSLDFNFQPLPQDNTPTFDIKVNAYARRVSESSAAEQLIGSVVANARISTELALGREIGRNSSVFADTGPIPPVAEQETTYTATLAVQNGSNDVVDAEVTTSIPQYVNWLDVVSGDGSIVYNPVSKIISWQVGAIDANATKQISFQIELLPSLSQTGTTPALLGEQRLRATDRFTGTAIRATAPPASTELSREAGFERGNGRVQDLEN